MTPLDRLAFVALALLVGAAVFAPFVTSFDPNSMVNRPLLPIGHSATHPLGTDQLGRDVWSRLMHGARLSISIGLSSAALAILVGALIGVTAAIGGPLLDGLLMRVTEAVQAVPTFLLVLAAVVAFGSAATTIAGAIAFAAWPTPARLVRAEASSLRTRPWVEALLLSGRARWRVVVFDVMPAAVRPVLALIGIAAGEAVLIESALSFLGLGEVNRPSWGDMIADGRAVMRDRASLVVLPGLSIACLVLTLSRVGDALERRLGLA